MGAMLWPVICIIAQRYDLDMGARETLPTWAVLSLSSTCIMLDAATLLACAQDSPTVLLIITLAHAPLYASMYASHLSYNLWILTKVFVVICTLGVRPLCACMPMWQLSLSSCVLMPDEKLQRARGALMKRLVVTHT